MKIAEIFSSVHGEINGHHQGRKVTFIRTAGCNLSCDFCDTPETQFETAGKDMTDVDILNSCIELKNKYICITGGEPLLQKDLLHILMQLNYYGFKISIETNGTMDVEPFFNWVESFVVDYKIQYPQKMFRKNFLILRPTDIIKIVVYTIQEAEHMLPLISEWQGYDTKAIIAFSPVHGFLEPSTLAEFLMAHDIPNCAISLQIHKIIGLK